MYIRRFTYKKEDVDCKLCTEYRGGKKCPHKICPYITDSPFSTSMVQVHPGSVLAACASTESSAIMDSEMP